MKKIRYILRLFFAFVGRFKGLMLLGIMIGVTLFFTARFSSPYIFKNSNETIGLSGRYNPNTLPDYILQMIGEGLTTLDVNDIPYPGLASSWETTDGGKTWIFNLRKDALWHDGQPVTSHSVVYEFSDVETDYIDDHTIVFKLQDAFAPFPAVVSRPTFRRGLMGTGKWKVDEMSVTGAYIQRLVLNDGNGNKRTFKFYPTLEATKHAYKMGEVQKIIEVLDASPFDRWETAEVTGYANYSQVVTLFYNNDTGIFHDNKPLRQALAYSIDKRFLSEEKAVSPLSPLSWAYNPQVKPYEYDPERAKEMIDDFPEEFRSMINIRIVTTPILLYVAERISQDWGRVGIKSTVQVSSVVPSEFDVYITIFDIPKDPDQYSVWYSTQRSTNISRYSNPRIDRLLEDGRTAIDFEERRRIYLDFQRFLVEDLPASFLYHPTYYTVARK
jgi:peptide/nickel transport system substrate-binding protein